MKSETTSKTPVAQPRLVRRYRHSTYLDFQPEKKCNCGGKLEVKDHRAPWFSPHYTASQAWRYEVSCDACGWCDCNGYANRREVIAAYPTNSGILPHVTHINMATVKTK